jgi:hypothetical protein
MGEVGVLIGGGGVGYGLVFCVVWMSRVWVGVLGREGWRVCVEVALVRVCCWEERGMGV